MEIAFLVYSLGKSSHSFQQTVGREISKPRNQLVPTPNYLDSADFFSQKKEKNKEKKTAII